MDAQPAGAKAQHAGGEQHIFDRGAGILEQKRKLPVVGLIDVATDQQGSGCPCEHLAVGQTMHQPVHGLTGSEDDEMPGIFSHSRGRGHTCLQQIVQQRLRDRLLTIFTDTSAAKETFQYRVHMLSE